MPGHWGQSGTLQNLSELAAEAAILKCDLLWQLHRDAATFGGQDTVCEYLSQASRIFAGRSSDHSEALFDTLS